MIMNVAGTGVPAPAPPGPVCTNRVGGWDTMISHFIQSVQLGDGYLNVTSIDRRWPILIRDLRGQRLGSKVVDEH